MEMDPGTTTQLLVGGYLLISVIGQAPAGKLGDIIGYQKALYIGLSVFMLGSLLAYLIRSIEVLLVSRMMMAAASAMIVPNASAMLRTQLPRIYAAICLRNLRGDDGCGCGGWSALGRRPDSILRLACHIPDKCAVGVARARSYCDDIEAAD